MYDAASHRGEQSRERQLWCAVIFRAVQDATQAHGPAGMSLVQTRERHEAREWFAENGKDYCYACESAGVDSEFLRERVLRFAVRADVRTGRELSPV